MQHIVSEYFAVGSLLRPLVFCAALLRDANSDRLLLEPPRPVNWRLMIADTSRKRTRSQTAAPQPSVEQRLTTANGEVASTKEELASTKEELASTKEELASTKKELASTKEELAAAQARIKKLKQKPLPELPGDVLAHIASKVPPHDIWTLSVRTEDANYPPSSHVIGTFKLYNDAKAAMREDLADMGYDFFFEESWKRNEDDFEGDEDEVAAKMAEAYEADLEALMAGEGGAESNFDLHCDERVDCHGGRFSWTEHSFDGCDCVVFSENGRTRDFDLRQYRIDQSRVQ